MQVTVFGATGYTGRHLLTELLERGHSVVAVSRSAATDLPDGVRVVTGDIHDPAVVDDATPGSQAILVAVGAIDGRGRRLAEAVPALVEAAASEGARLGVVGNAGSLSREPGGPRVYDEADFPADWKPGSLALTEVLDTLRATGRDVDWFFLSPALGYGSYAPGERRGAYRTGGDEVVADADGRSFISGPDFATAMVDELERPAHHRARFTVGY
jgi:putative NADH-flavin reductase